MIQRNGRTVPGFGVGLGFGNPGDWYYTRFVYPSDVKEAKSRVDVTYQSVNNDVKACAGLTDADRASWNTLFNAWRAFYCLGDPSCTTPDASVFGSGGQMDDVDKYEKVVYDWQKKLGSSSCVLSSPIETPAVVKREEDKKESDIMGTVKTVAIVVAVTAGVVMLVPIVAEIGQLIPKTKTR